MFSPFASLTTRLEAVYREQPYFSQLTARLLAGFCVLLLTFIPFNIAKLVWFEVPALAVRLAFNLTFATAAAVALALVFRGRLHLAGAALTLILIIPVHLIAFLIPPPIQPLAGAFQFFAFDLLCLIMALAFSTRAVALLVLAIAVGSHVAFYFLELHAPPIRGSLEFAATTILRDGLITMGFVFCLGGAIAAQVRSAQRRSEQALRDTRATNENLERLVAERTEELSRAMLRANEASQAKGDFLANISHEIRTPLNGIIASSELLLYRDDLPREAMEHSRLIAESGDLLLKLLGDVLDISKIESGHVELETVRFDLAQLLETCVDLVAAKARVGGVSVQFSIAPGIGKSFEGDSLRLRQVLLNLLSNAIKFTPDGGRVDLEVSTTDAQASPTLLHFAVRDTGIGLDNEAITRIFQRFTQAESSTSRRYGGTGLGLAISYRLVDLMGGRLTVRSEPNRGAEFSFTLPFRPVAPVASEPTTTPTPIPRLDLDVLVADDNVTNRRIIAAQLEKLGCRCTMATNGNEVLDALRTGPLPQVILMDCDMPELDGWAATREMRRWADQPDSTRLQQRAATLPVIAITAATQASERDRCFDAGMNDFLAKPIKLTNLQRILQPFAADSLAPPTIAR